jgi:glutamate synthase domain-containing protein 3
LSTFNVKKCTVRGMEYALIESDGMVIDKVQDGLDLMANADSGKIILQDHQVNPDFFRLRTGFAGELLQKFMNYGVSLAVIGDFSKYPGDTLRDFIRERNKNGRIVFAASQDEALNLWNRAG